MLFRNSACIVALMFSSIACFSQIKISGSVRDSLNKALAAVSVSLKRETMIVQYAKTDSNGNFQFLLPAGFLWQGYSLEARLIGYAPSSSMVRSAQEHYPIILTQTVINLKGVNIKHKPIITVKGDTLNYRTADFANQNDRSIGDVLSKIPGITVGQDGKITYNNKAISQLYLDGDNLLDDQYNVGTKSIPHKVVTKVQVIENDQPIKMLQKNNLSDQVALNLVIDKNAKLSLIGNASLAAGLPDRYEENMDLILFKNSLKLLDNIALNNTGIDLSQDMIAHNALLRARISGNEQADFQLATGISPTPLIPKTRSLMNNSGILNTNTLFKFNPDQQVKVNLYYLYNMNHQHNTHTTQLNLPDQAVSFGEDQQNRATHQRLYTQLNYIENTKSNYLNTSFSLDYRPQVDRGDIRNQDSPFSAKLNQKRLNLTNHLQYLKTLPSGKVLNLNSYIENSDQSEQLTLDPGILPAAFHQGTPYAALNQKVRLPGFFTNNFITYSLQQGKLTQSYQAGITFQATSLNSELSLKQSDHTLSAYPNAVNQIRWYKFKAYVSPGLDYKTEELLVSARMPVSLNVLTYSQNDTHHTNLFLNPSLSLRYTIDQQNKLSAGYAFSNSQGSIQDIFAGAVLQNYRTLVAHAIPLPFGRSHYASMGYQFKKAVSLLFGSVQLTLDRTLQDNLASETIDRSIQISRFVPLKNSSTTLGIHTTIGKYMTSITTNFSLGAALRQSHGKLFQNERLFPYLHQTFTLEPAFSTKIQQHLNLNYQGSYIRSTTTTAGQSGPALDQLTQSMKINATIFQCFTLGANLSHLYVKQQHQPHLHYFFTDLTLRFNWLGLKTNFELALNNLTNVRSFDTYVNTLNRFTSANYLIPGRNVLLKATFSFN